MSPSEERIGDEASSSSEAVAYRAKWVLPITEPPIEDGLVTVIAGRIVEVGTATSARKVIDLADAVLLPALVNAHSHLELSAHDRPLGQERQPFPDWIAEVVSMRRQAAQQLPAEELRNERKVAIRRGLNESSAAGVALVGDIASASFPAEPYAEGLLGGVVFEELIGLAEERIEPLLAQAASHLDRSAVVSAGGQWLPGLSPHAPYTVHPELVRRVCELSAQRKCVVAMHLAESPAEMQLLADHQGAFVAILESVGAWQPASIPRGSRPIDYLQQLAIAHRALVIHGNYLDAQELAFLAQHRDAMTLVYCPRTQHYFHADKHPLLEALKAGVRVALGTDSRASNPDLSVWEELQFVRRNYPSLTEAALLKMATLDAAAALGCDADYGSLEVGKRGALVVAESSSAGVSLFERTLRRLP